MAVGRRNWTFAGSDEGGRRAATIYSLVQTCRLNDVDPAPGSSTSWHGCQARRRTHALDLEGASRRRGEARDQRRRVANRNPYPTPPPTAITGASRKRTALLSQPNRVMTDNGSSFRSGRYAKALRLLKIRHLRALRPDRPPGVGLRPSLPNLSRPRSAALALAPPLQLASTPWQYRIKTANPGLRASARPTPASRRTSPSSGRRSAR